MVCKNYRHKMVGKYPISYCSKYNNTCTVEVERPCQLHTEIMELKGRIRELEDGLDIHQHHIGELESEEVE